MSERRDAEERARETEAEEVMMAAEKKYAELAESIGRQRAQSEVVISQLEPN